MNATLLKENPLLLLITIQAYAVNDLVVEPEIKQLILDNIDLLKEIKPEDAYKEFKCIMTTVHPDRYIREFKEVFFALIPGLKETYGFNQNNKWHIYDVFEHTMHVIENTDSDSAALRIAALFHDLGKPSAYTKEEKKKEDGTTYTVGHFYGHNIKSNIFFNEFAKTMHIPEEEKKLISKLIVYHDYHLSLKPEKIQEYVDDLGAENIPLLFALKRADNLAQNPELTKEVLEQLDETEKVFMEYISKMPKQEEPEKPVKKN